MTAATRFRVNPSTDTRDRVIAMEVTLNHVLTKVDAIASQMTVLQELHQQAKGGWKLARLLHAPIGGVVGYLAANATALASWLTLPPH